MLLWKPPAGVVPAGVDVTVEGYVVVVVVVVVAVGVVDVVAGLPVVLSEVVKVGITEVTAVDVCCGAVEENSCSSSFSRS